MNTPLRILLIEDNKHDRIAFKRAFKSSQIACTITEYDRVEKAPQKAEIIESLFDIVITDNIMPGMSGLDFCKILLDAKLSLPIILLTGTGSEQIAVEALKAGVDDYIIN